MYNYDYSDDFARLPQEKKKWYHVLLHVLLWIWQLPQNLLGFILSTNVRHNGGQRYIYCLKIKGKMHEIRFVHFNAFPGGITLGEYIVIGGRLDESDVRHEYGHVRQSRMLGWLYLVVIGIPSLWHACWHDKLWAKNKEYSHFWTEKWAENLGSE